jgi:hypothetical protein
MHGFSLDPDVDDSPAKPLPKPRLEAENGWVHVRATIWRLTALPINNACNWRIHPPAKLFSRIPCFQNLCLLSYQAAGPCGAWQQAAKA